MSLSFVSKAIQTTTEDGNFEEKPVEDAKETGGASSVTAAPGGLFEQLRRNKEEAEAEREEFQRSIMRGTLALDEDDAAHLEQLHQRREEEMERKRQQIESDLVHFRAAQADRQHQQQLGKQSEKEGKDGTFDVQTFETTERPAEKKFAPTVLIKKKKKRKRVEEVDKNPSEEKERKNGTESGDAKVEAKTHRPNETETKTAASEGISSLLAGYSSSSDEDEE